MTQIAFGLPIYSQAEGEQVVAGIAHPVFQRVLQATKWSTFYTEWRVFQWLRRDFYRLMGRGAAP
jgi:hypothetical protein